MANMKIPKIFVPNKDLEQYTNELLNKKEKKEDPQTQPIDNNTVCEYERICVSKMRRAFFKTRFTPEESDAVIEDLITKIKQYAESKGRTIDAYKKYDERRIRKTKITSRDGLVRVDVEYNDEGNPVIHAELNFYSRSGADMEEYKGLAQIIREMGKDFKFVI